LTGRRRIELIESIPTGGPLVPAWIRLLALYALMWGVLIWHVGARPDPDNRPEPWPSGVPEGEPVRYAVGAITPPAPPEHVEAVATAAVRSHTSAIGR
jgi:hypothetical protein